MAKGPAIAKQLIEKHWNIGDEAQDFLEKPSTFSFFLNLTSFDHKPQDLLPLLR